MNNNQNSNDIYNKNVGLKKRKKYFRNILIACVGAVVVVGGIKLALSPKDNKVTKKYNNKKVEEQNNGKVEHKPTDIVKGGNTTYEGLKYAMPAKEVAEMLKGTYKGEGKKVFLTFDDGPSAVDTPKVLDALKEKKVHGTFFVLGQRLIDNENAREALKRSLIEGNAIGNHSFTHDLKKLYPHRSVDINYFMEEYNKTQQEIQSIVGKDFNTKVLRLPGGYMSRRYYKDPNLKAFDETLAKDGIVSIDWNALDGDAEGKPYTEEQMLEYVKKTTGDKQNVVILMHDIKKKTVKILPQIIDFYKSQGYEFKTIKN